MKFRDFANQREAEAGTGNAGILHAGYTIKLFEDAAQVAFRNAVSLVCHIDQHAIFFGACGDRDRRAVGTVLHGIGNQILHRP